jgi:hypothetical protein
VTTPGPRRRGLLLLLAGGGLALLAPAPAAEARSSSLLPYPAADVWPTAVRFLRIDRGATVREKDADSGYVLFDLPEGGKTWKGSLELVRTSDGDGREATRVMVSLPDLPRLYEGVLLDKRAAKVREEHGSPAPPPPKKPPPEPPRRPDGGAGR